MLKGASLPVTQLNAGFANNERYRKAALAGQSIIRHGSIQRSCGGYRREIDIAINKGSHLLATLEKGSSFGEQAVVGTKYRMATAKTDSVCLEIPADWLGRQISSAPPLLKHVFSALTLQLLQRNHIASLASTELLCVRTSVDHFLPRLYAELCVLLRRRRYPKSHSRGPRDYCQLRQA